MPYGICQRNGCDAKGENSAPNRLRGFCLLLQGLPLLSLLWVLLTEAHGEIFPPITDFLSILHQHILALLLSDALIRQCGRTLIFQNPFQQRQRFFIPLFLRLFPRPPQNRLPAAILLELDKLRPLSVTGIALCPLVESVLAPVQPDVQQIPEGGCPVDQQQLVHMCLRILRIHIQHLIQEILPKIPVFQRIVRPAQKILQSGSALKNHHPGSLLMPRELAYAPHQILHGTHLGHILGLGGGNGIREIIGAHAGLSHAVVDRHDGLAPVLLHHGEEARPLVTDPAPLHLLPVVRH